MARGKLYIDEPVTVVFKTSNRSNAQTKMKTFNNRNVDEVIDPKYKLPGIPENAIWLEVGLGESYIERFKSKYKL
jgi:hypothetical protein